jgi:hypothetical protein
MPSRTKNYLLDVSIRFTVAERDGISWFRAKHELQGHIQSPQTGNVSGDALARQICTLLKGQIHELAYADVIDNKIEKIQQVIVDLQNKLYGTGDAIQGITKTLNKLIQRQNEMIQRQDNIIKLLAGSCV